jgi:hypothetical protein
MADPTLTIVFSIAYNLILWLGMKIMKNRAPFSLKPVVAIHNFFLVSLSAYMTVELLRYGITLGLCGAVDYSASGIPVRVPENLCVPLPLNNGALLLPQLAKVIWMFYFSKLPEFFDTVRRFNRSGSALPCSARPPCSLIDSVVVLDGIKKEE